MIRYCFLLLLLFSANADYLCAQTAPERLKQGYEVSAEGAWCWFADPRAIHHKNEEKGIDKSYLGYIDVHGNIKAMQYDFQNQQQEEVLIRSWFQPDDHDNPTFLILPDDRVMIFYSRHTDESCFYYRISQQPGDIRTLGEEKRLETDHNTTYPSPFILADDPTHIYLCWRGINWHPTIARLTLPDQSDEVHFVGKPHQIVQSTGARPYAKYVSNGQDKIYITYTTGHPDNENPNFLYFNYIDVSNLTLHDIKGKQLSAIEKAPFQVNKTADYLEKFPITVVDHSGDRDWVWQVAIARDGAPVIAYVRISADKKTHDYYYGKWTGSTWQTSFVAHGGGHFHQSKNLEMCYSGGMAIDPDKINELYCSVPVKGRYGEVYELHKYSLDSKGNIQATEALTSNSSKNNVRPYIIAGSTDSPLRLTWMHGDYYDWIVSKSRPGYPTAIYSDFKGFEQQENLTKGLVYTGNAFQGKLPKTFSIALQLASDTAQYGGTLLQLGTLSYRLNAESRKPEIVYGGKVYPSSNILGTADSWLQANRGTSGIWYTPTKLENFQLTFTYDKGILRSYINGLLDQQLDIGSWRSVSVDLESPNGWVRQQAVYKRLLNRTELKRSTLIQNK